jgi:mRNA-degrading endonuclease YafQ of YafQ-DinJ toxin-antitoxin module
VRFVVSSRFARRAKKLKAPQDELLRAALRRFAADPRDPVLHTHKLKGELAEYWAFTVDEDLRVLFRWDGEACFLVTMGGHDEVY